MVEDLEQRRSGSAISRSSLGERCQVSEGCKSLVMKM